MKLNEHAVWRHIQKEWKVHDLLVGLPDEFHQWVIDVSEGMFNRYIDMEIQVHSYFDGLTDADLLDDREGFALAIKDLAPWLKSSLLLMLDSKDFSKILWKQIEPKKTTLAY